MNKVNPQNLKSIGDRIRFQRQQMKMSLNDFADKMGFSKQQLSNYELDKRQIDKETLVKIAKELNVSTDYLLGNTQSKNINNSEISMKLGLNDNAIEKLSLYANKTNWDSDIFNGDITSHQYYSLIINKIIENDDFEKLIYFIRRYINSFRIEELKKEILLNEVVYKDKLTGKDITNKDILNDCIEQGIYDKDFEESSTDICEYKIKVIFNKIIESIVDDLEPVFAENWTLDDEKKNIIPICRDGSESNKWRKGKRGDKNGNHRNNKE